MNETRTSSAARPRSTQGLLLSVVVLAWLLAMAPLAFWGLPDSNRDTLLFGGRSPWPAERYGLGKALEQRRVRSGGADTDLNPLTDRDRLVDLAADDAQRAEILRRYRLFTRQPDEMITLMALQRMNPRRFDFDPQLYQYGGAYIYLVGAGIGAGALTGAITITRDEGLYLQRPELFARFFLVGRFISLVAGALTLVAVFQLAGRVSPPVCNAAALDASAAKPGAAACGCAAGWVALLFAAATPVFMTEALEAKPHLPSVCMILWSLLAALDYAGRQRPRDAVRIGLLSGLSLGFVLSGAVSLLTWLPLLRRTTLRMLALAGGLAAAIYVATNPFLVWNLLFHCEAVSSNLGNSTAMYSVGKMAVGAVRVLELLVESSGPGVLAAGIVGFVLLMRRWPRRTFVASAAGLAMLAIAAVLGAGKPAEFARFLLLPVLLLCAAAGWAISRLLANHRFAGLVAIALVLVMMPTLAYVRSFAVDAAGEHESRRASAVYLAATAEGDDAIGLIQEPAPYSVPPLDFGRRRVVLLPPAEPRNLDVAALPRWLVFTADDERVHRGAWWQRCYQQRFTSGAASPSPIAWANKPVFVYEKRVK